MQPSKTPAVGDEDSVQFFPGLRFGRRVTGLRLEGECLLGEAGVEVDLGEEGDHFPLHYLFDDCSELVSIARWKARRVSLTGSCSRRSISVRSIGV